MITSKHFHWEENDVVRILGIPILINPVLNGAAGYKTPPYTTCLQQHLIVTANPEILVRTTRDERYRSIIQNADAVVADGFGVILAGLLQGKRTKRVTGVELTQELIHLAQEKDLPVHFALFGSGLTTLDDLRARFPDLRLSDPHEATIVIASFGAPKQEYWLDEHKDEFPNARIMIGVGGALDYLCGKVKRAPALVRAIGLEWLWRLSHQPKRWKRIWHAVVVFPFLVVKGLRKYESLRNYE